MAATYGKFISFFSFIFVLFLNFDTAHAECMYIFCRSHGMSCHAVRLCFGCGVWIDGLSPLSSQYSRYDRVLLYSTLLYSTLLQNHTSHTLAKLNVFGVQIKSLLGAVDGWMDGWMDGWIVAVVVVVVVVVESVATASHSILLYSTLLYYKITYTTVHLIPC